MPRLDLASKGMTEVLLASAARTTSANGTASTGWGATSTIRAQLNVTAASGTTPSLVVRLEDSLDGTNWNTIATFTAATAVTREVLNVTTPFADQVRVAWTVAGTTPSFTFTVSTYSE